MGVFLDDNEISLGALKAIPALRVRILSKRKLKLQVKNVSATISIDEHHERWENGTMGEKFTFLNLSIKGVSEELSHNNRLYAGGLLGGDNYIPRRNAQLKYFKIRLRSSLR